MIISDASTAAAKKESKTEKKRNQWPRVREVEHKNGTKAWQVDARIKGVGERLYYPTPTEADTKAEALRARLKNEGALSRQLTDRERAEAVACIEDLLPYGADLRMATDLFIKLNKLVAADAATVPVLFAEFKEHLVTKKRSPSYRKAFEDYIGPFVKAHQGPIGMVTSTQLDAWAKQWTDSEHSRWHFGNYVRTFFNWCRDLKKALPKGETEADLLDFSKPKTQRIQVYTPEEMEILLRFAKDDGEIALLALGGFVGLRNSEITGEKTDHGPLQAQDILFDGDAVRTIQKVQNQSVERFAPMTKNAASWLKPFQGKTGPIIVCETAGAVIHEIIGRAAAAGHVVPFKRNGLRRSHITYRTTIKQNPAIVADECNTSPSRIKANYRRRDILLETAKRWVAMRRKSTDK